MRFFTILLLYILFQTPASAQFEYQDKALLVRFYQKNVLNEMRNKDLSSLNWELVSASTQLYKVTWSDDISIEKMENNLNSWIGNSGYISKNYKSSQRNTIPNDPSYDLQWYHKTIRSSAIWSNITGGLTGNGDTIVVAVLERNNIDFQHEDLQELIWFNKQEIPDNGIDDDGNGYIDDYLGLNARNRGDNKVTPDNHSTRVAGIIGANTNNQIGVSGINWDLRILSVSNVEYIDEILRGFEYVLNMRKKYNDTNGAEGALIVALNASFGFDKTKPADDPVFQEWCDLIEMLGQEGILTIGATANNRWDVDFVGDMPTNCTSEYFIGVTASNRIDTLDRIAAFGAQSIDLAAPGEAIFSTRTGNMYNSDSGTSFAAPMVTGAVALLYSMPDAAFSELMLSEPQIAAQHVKNAILDGVDQLPSFKNRTVTGGRLNLFGALEQFSRLGFGVLPEQILIANLHPNPVSEDLYYNIGYVGFEEHEILIFDMQGNLCYEEKKNILFVKDVQQKVNVRNLIPGVYIISIRNGKKIASGRFVKADSAE
jgi:hypothetical protein